MKSDLQTLFDRATASHEAGRWHEAERDYRVILNADPNHPDALHQLGLLAYQTGNAAVAIDLVSRAAARAPDRGAFHNTLGGALLEVGRTEDALAAFERASRLMPDSIEVRNNLAKAMHTAGDIGGALAIYRSLIADAPNDADVNNNIARALEAAGEFEEAVRHYRIAVSARPDDAVVLSQLGNALCAMHTFDEAMAVCERAASLAPHSPVVLANLGNALMAQRRFGPAIAAYTKAIAGAPQLAELQMNLGIAHHAAGDWVSAAECFEKLLAGKVDARARIALARTYVSMGRLDGAVTLFREALAAQPDDREVRLALGLALNDLGRHAEGLAEIARGPGLTRLSLKEAGPIATERRSPSLGAGPNFIGSWFLDDRSLCDRLIAFFDRGAARHRQGRTSAGIDLAIKDATDLVIYPNDLEKADFVPVAAYLRELEACMRDYVLQWPHVGEIFGVIDLVPFQIQRYTPGQHFQSPHSERMTAGLMHRAFAWMTYLNDVEEGGRTRFHYFDLDVKPERGKTLIWPAEWTHMHAGEVVRSGTKYIITGWMHFPLPAA